MICRCSLPHFAFCFLCLKQAGTSMHAGMWQYGPLQTHHNLPVHNRTAHQGIQQHQHQQQRASLHLHCPQTTRMSALQLLRRQLMQRAMGTVQQKGY